MSFSIKAYLGLETKDFNKGLKDAEGAQKASAKRMTDNEKKGGEERKESVNKVKREVSELASTILEGGASADVFANTLARVAGLIHASLGTVVGAGVAVVFSKAINDAIEETHKLKEEIEALGQPSSSPEFSTLEALQKQLAATIAAADKVQDNLDSPIAHAFKEGTTAAVDAFRRNPDRSISGKILDAAMEGRIALNASGGEEAGKLKTVSEAAQAAIDGIAAKEQDTADIEAERLVVGEHAARLLEIQLELHTKIAAINEQRNELAKHGVTIDGTFAEAAAKRAARIKEASLAEQERKAQRPASDAGAVLQKQVDGHEQLSQMLATELNFRREIEDANKAGNRDLAYQLAKNKELTLEKQAQDIIDANRARHQGTLEDVAKHGGGRARTEAQRALREDKLSREAYERGNIRSGDRHGSIADRIRGELGRRGIIPKQPDFAADFDKSQLLKDIRDGIKNISTI